MKFYLRQLLFSIFLFSSSAGLSEASVLSVSATPATIGTGETAQVQILLNTNGKSINAVQATVEFPVALLEYVGEDRAKSIFNFWVEEPTESGGSISFTGGTPSGATGPALQIITLKFKSKGAGTANISLNNAIVTANDGAGTNVLQEIKEGKITIGTTITSPAVPTSEGGTASAVAPVVSQPQRIVRTVEASSKKPAAPKVRVPLYPAEDRWFSSIGEVTAFWDVPGDVASVAVIMDKVPSTTPSKYEVELYDGKKIGQATEGVSYVHVRFKNSAGASPVTHYKIQIDTADPLPFTIQSSEGTATTNPRPELSFEAQDELSGVDHYEIQVDKQDIVTVEGSTATLPHQFPGKKVVVVTAVDKAGNRTEWFYNLEILPIQAPTVSPIENLPYVGEGNFLVRGTSEKSFFISGKVKSLDGEVQSEANVVADEVGNWEIVFDDPLKKGMYIVEIVAQDERGGSSLPITSAEFKVGVRPLLVIAGFGLTPNVFFAILITLLLALFGLAYFSYTLWRQQLDRRAILAQRDVSGLAEMILKDIDQMLASWSDKKVTKSELTNIEATLRKMSKNIAQLQKYIISNIAGISK